MKRKKINFYILFPLILLLIMFFIDNMLEGSVGEYFTRSIMFDREVVDFSGTELIRGTFYWKRLKDILLGIAFFGIIAIEAAIYISSKISRKKERENVINEVEERLNLMSEGKTPEEINDLKLIDARINSILDERSMALQEIREEASKKNDLVTYLAHDLKTPLTTIIGYLTILHESEVPEEARKNYIDKVLEKSYRLESLINQFFDIIRFNLQEIPLNKTNINGTFFLEQLTEELYHCLEDKSLRFQVEMPSDMNIYGDGPLLARLINNLLKYAIAYSRAGSVIKITGKSDKDSTLLTFENDGDNISNQELQLMFQKFYRRDKARSQASGAGLGLAIARQIAEKHGGTLEADSDNGHTTFTLSLPSSK